VWYHLIERALKALISVHISSHVLTVHHTAQPLTTAGEAKIVTEYVAKLNTVVSRGPSTVRPVKRVSKPSVTRRPRDQDWFRSGHIVVGGFQSLC